MAAFPSSWILESGGASSSPSPPNALVSYQRPRCSCENHTSFDHVPGTHDDLYPFWKLQQSPNEALSRRISAPSWFGSPTSHSPLQRSHHIAITPTIEEENAEPTLLAPLEDDGSDGRYPTCFPARWMIPAPEGANSRHNKPMRVKTQRENTSKYNTKLPPTTTNFATPVDSPTFKDELPIRDHIHISAWHKRLGLQEVVVDDDSGLLPIPEDLLAELKGQTWNDDRKAIENWVQSMQRMNRACVQRGVPMTKDQKLRLSNEKHPASFYANSMYSDESGLGDAPHMGPDIIDNYSNYSTSSSEGTANPSQGASRYTLKSPNTWSAREPS